jgi:maleate cis-trans isomerase
MFEHFAPKYKLGCLVPGLIVDNHAYEFYRLAPKGVMEVMVGVGLKEFSKSDVERVFSPVDKYVQMLMDRDVDMIIQNGVPLPILIGIDAHDRLLEHIRELSGLSVTSTVLSVVKSAKDLGAKKIAVANKWTDEMNHCLDQFFARGGSRIVGKSVNELAPVDFHKIKSDQHMQLAYELGKRAFLENPECDAVYIGGGSWIAEPVAVQLEREFDKPVICNQAAVIRTALQMLGAWTPQGGHSRLLALP